MKTKTVTATAKNDPKIACSEKEKNVQEMLKVISIKIKDLAKEGTWPCVGSIGYVETELQQLVEFLG